MSDHLSVSQINTFLRCPMQYEFSYINGIKIPPAGVMIQGSAYHEAVGLDLKSKQIQGTTLRDDDIITIYSESFDKFTQENVTDWRDDTPSNAKDVGTRLALLYHRQYTPHIKPVLVEEWQELEINGVKFVLITDLVTEEKVIDHKVVARRYSEDQLAREVQATAYTYVHRKPFEYHLALKQKEEKIEPALATRDEKDWLFFETLVDKINKTIESGLFAPNPSTFWCSEKYCGYYKLCRGRYG